VSHGRAKAVGGKAAVGRPAIDEAAGAIHFFDAFERMLAFLDDPSAGNRRGFYGLLLKELMQATACTEGSLLLTWPAGQADALRLEAVHGISAEVWAGESGAPQGSAAAEALRTMKPVHRKGAFGHSLALPLAYQGRPLGAAMLSHEHAFSAADAAAGAKVALGMGRVLKAFQDLQSRRRQDRQLQAIISAGAAVQRFHDLEPVLDRIAREAEALVEAEGASVFLLQPDGSMVAPVATGAGGARLKDLRLAPGEGVVGWVAAHGETARVQEADQDPRFTRRVDQATQAVTRSLLAVPMQLEGRVLGVLEVVNKRGHGGFNLDEEAPLQALALLAAVAIENAQRMGALAQRANRLDQEVARASLEASESRARLESVLFAMGDAVIAADENGLVTLVNRAAQFLAFGLGLADPMGQPLTSMLPAPAFEKALADVRSRSEAATVELELGAEGAFKAFACIVTPSKDLDGYLTGLVVVLRDITRTRELERMKTAFLNTVSHELRTPITSIRAFSELMLRKEADAAKVHEWSGVINEEAERLNRLIDDLLDVSRLEAGKQLTIAKRPVELAPLLERFWTLFAAQESNHPLALSLNPDLTLAELDPDRFIQILTNLVSNAIKYSPDGGPVELSVDFAPPQSLRVEVRDHGLGLSADDKAHLFEKFYRVEGAHMQGIRGTGLGLSITKYLVEAHGGRIGVISEKGKGSTFWFEIPLFAPLDPAW
jgi:two-component system phosphate regulon sensor histidine kinase PhoR